MHDWYSLKLKAKYLANTEYQQSRK